MYVVGGSAEGDDETARSWIGMYITDDERVLEKVVNLVGVNPTRVLVQILYLDRILFFSRKRINF